MKKRITVALLSLSIFSGCTQTQGPNPSVVTIHEKCATDTLEIIDIKGQKRADGFMQIQVVGRNNANEYQKLEYKIVWLDGNGFVIKSILSKWREASADAKQEFYITNISPNAKANDFKLYIRQNNKEILCEQEQNRY